MDLTVCGSYAVPGMFCYAFKGDYCSVNVIERDEQNRILFEYNCYSVIEEKEKKAYVICQKYDSNYVYYYEDICFSFSDDEETLSELKAQNDWGKSLNQSKMSRRKCDFTFDLEIIKASELDYGEAREVCAKTFGINEEKIAELCFIDSDSAGNEMCFLKTASDEEKKYLVVINKDYEIDYLCLTEDLLETEDFIEFKKRVGWVYGF